MEKKMNNYELNLGIYDMKRDTTGLPKSLAIRINSHVCNGSGGGGSTSTQKGGYGDVLDPLMNRLFTGALDDADKNKAAGPYATVAKLTDDQERANQLKLAQGKAQVDGTGIYDMKAANNADLQNAWGVNKRKVSFGGASGSARELAAEKAMMQNISRDQFLERQNTVNEGIKNIGGAGSAYQRFNQQLLDSRKKENQDIANLVSGNAPKSQTTTGGGGKG